MKITGGADERVEVTALSKVGKVVVSVVTIAATGEATLVLQ
jgi:hypothetical protein